MSETQVPLTLAISEESRCITIMQYLIISPVFVLSVKLCS